MPITSLLQYTPFTVDYLPISAYDATRPFQTPDSLVVMLISSASLNRQQGSWLCVDSLVLWHDACPDTVEVVAVPDTHSVALSWSVSDPVEGFELRYFPWTAFEPEETTVTLTGNSFTLTGLEAGRLYEAAIRTVCSSGRYGEWNWFQFSTLADTCARITSITVDSGNVAFTSDHMVTGYVATWTSSFEPEKWIVHCSMDGLMLNDTVYAPTFAFPPLPQDQLCFFQVRAACHDSILGVANSVMFTTLADTTSPVGILLGADHGLLSVWPNPAKDRLTVESPVKQVTAVEVYDVHWRLLIDGLSNTVDLSGLPSGVYFLRVKTADGRSAFARFIKE